MNDKNDNSKCPICGSKNLSYRDLPFPPISPLSYSINHGNNTTLFICNRCAIIARANQSSDESYYLNPESDINNIDSVVNVYSAKDGGHVTNHHVMAQILKTLLQQNQTNILDIGCGNGYFLKELNKNNPQYNLHGFDIPGFLSQKFLDFKNITYHHGDIQNVSEKFNAITFIDSLSYIKSIKNLFLFFDSNLNNDGIIFITSPDVSKNVITLLMDRQPYFFTEENLTNLFEVHGYRFNKIDVCETFPRHIFGYAKKSDSHTYLQNIEINNTIDASVDYMERLRRNLNRIRKWWNLSSADRMRLGVLGTNHNSAVTLHALSKEISFVANETELYNGLNFYEKPIIHPRDMSDNDYLILPYGITAKQIRRRFKKHYSGRFINI